jgi:hypothetical protein
VLNWIDRLHRLGSWPNYAPLFAFLTVRSHLQGLWVWVYRSSWQLISVVIRVNRMRWQDLIGRLFNRQFSNTKDMLMIRWCGPLIDCHMACVGPTYQTFSYYVEPTCADVVQWGTALWTAFDEVAELRLAMWQLGLTSLLMWACIAVPCDMKLVMWTCVAVPCDIG